MVDCVCFNPAERRQAGRWYAIGDRTLQKEALCFHLGAILGGYIVYLEKGRWLVGCLSSDAAG